MRYLSVLGLILVCAAGETSLAQTAVPNTFASGTAARASEVNANFQAVVTAINNLAARVTKLEGGPTTDADIVGTYRMSNLQIGISQVAVGVGEVEAISYEGSFTFAADHTFSATFTGKLNDSRGPHPDDGTVTGTWTLANNEVTAGVGSETPSTLHCASGCRLILGTLFGGSSGPGDDGHNNMLILVRN